jgi:4-pyridoxolactonase
MSDTKVYLLDGGSIVIDGFHMFWNVGPAGEIRIPVYSVLVEHKEGRFLFDSGFDYDHMMRVLPFEKPQQTADQTIPGALAQIGLKTDDVTHMVNSHFHIDHAGGNKHIKKAELFCHREEWAACLDPQPFERLGYSYVGFAAEMITARAKAAGQPQPEIDPTLARPWTFLHGDVEVAKNLWLLETPGHTDGHYSLLVKGLDRKPIMFVFDVVYCKANLERNICVSFHSQPAQLIKSMQRIRDLAREHDADLFFSHDAAEYATYRKAPAHYA